MAAEFEVWFKVYRAGGKCGARNDLFISMTFTPDTTRVAGALIS